MSDSSDGKDFFISFTARDQPWAEWVAWVLHEAGYSVCGQLWTFRGNFIDDMDKAHEAASRTLGILSPEALESAHVQQEWNARRADDPENKRDSLILITVRSCRPPGLLKSITRVEIVGLDEEAARQKLLDRVHGVSRHPRPTRFPGGSGSTAPEKPRFPVPPHNLPQPDRRFVGRTAELAALQAALSATRRSAITQPHAVTGLGGIGKTQLALHYAYAHLADYELIHWLRAEEPATLAADYAGLAAPLGLDPATPDQAALIAAIRRSLERRPGWLLVFDNATDPASLAPYLPPTGTGHILITSRRQDWDGTAESLELAVLPEADAVALLLGTAPDAPATTSDLRSDLPDAVGRIEDPTPPPDPARREAAALAADLGFLPLALTQARAFMQARKVGIPAYRRQLAASRAKVLQWRPSGAAYSLPVAEVWQTSLDAAAADCAGARPLLELLAFLAPDAIPRSLLSAAPEALPEPLRDSFDRDSAIEALHRFSLLRADPDSLTVHRLVQAVAADRLDEPTARERAGSAVQLLNHALPRPPMEHTNWPSYAALLAHVLAATAQAERLAAELKTTGMALNNTALYQYSRAAWTEAEPLLRRALAIGETTLGPEHPDLAIQLNNLAALYRATGRYGEAEPLFRRALAIDEKALGPEHPGLATDLNNLAVLYRATGRYAEAEPLFRRAIAITEKTLGPEHPELAKWLNNLAGLYRATGRYGEAEPLYRRALTIGETTLGPEHPNLGIQYGNLAGMYEATGRYAEAEPLRLRAVEIHEKALGPDHPYVATGLNNLALLYEATGRYGEAEPLYRRTLEIFEKTLPLDHPHIAIVSDNYAVLLEELGRQDEAARLRARAEAIRQQRARGEGQQPDADKL